MLEIRKGMGGNQQYGSGILGRLRPYGWSVILLLLFVVGGVYYHYTRAGDPAAAAAAADAVASWDKLPGDLPSVVGKKRRTLCALRAWVKTHPLVIVGAQLLLVCCLLLYWGTKEWRARRFSKVCLRAACGKKGFAAELEDAFEQGEMGPAVCKQLFVTVCENNCTRLQWLGAVFGAAESCEVKEIDDLIGVAKLLDTDSNDDGSSSDRRLRPNIVKLRVSSVEEDENNAKRDSGGDVHATSDDSLLNQDRGDRQQSNAVEPQISLKVEVESEENEDGARSLDEDGHVTNGLPMSQDNQQQLDVDLPSRYSQDNGGNFLDISSHDESSDDNQLQLSAVKQQISSLSGKRSVRALIISAAASTIPFKASGNQGDASDSPAANLTPVEMKCVMRALYAEGLIDRGALEETVIMALDGADDDSDDDSDDNVLGRGRQGRVVAAIVNFLQRQQGAMDMECVGYFGDIKAVVADVAERRLLPGPFAREISDRMPFGAICYQLAEGKERLIGQALHGVRCAADIINGKVGPFIVESTEDDRGSKLAGVQMNEL